jgi:hypothetical protein
VNNFSISWKLVFVAASALVLTAVVPLFTTAVAYADVFRPAIEIAPLERSADRPPAWTEDSIPSTQVDGQPQAPCALWATRLRSPANMLVHRAAMPDDMDQERRLSPGSIIGLICAIAASSVALGIAFGLRRKIDRIAGPDPDKADDD